MVKMVESTVRNAVDTTYIGVLLKEWENPSFSFSLIYYNTMLYCTSLRGAECVCDWDLRYLWGRNCCMFSFWNVYTIRGACHCISITTGRHQIIKFIWRHQQQVTHIDSYYRFLHLTHNIYKLLCSLITHTHFVFFFYQRID